LSAKVSQESSVEANSSEEDVNKTENDNDKTKYHYSKELVAKFPHAQPAFKNHLEKQFK